jgi:hypothetical protein
VRVIVHERALAQEIVGTEKRQSFLLAEWRLIIQFDLTLDYQKEVFTRAVFLKQHGGGRIFHFFQTPSEQRPFTCVQTSKQLYPRQKILN